MADKDHITKDYDFILAGGGAAGLSLACHLAHSPLREASILIVDRDAKDQNDRTWGFWTDRPVLFDKAVDRSWSKIKFVGSASTGECLARTIGLKDYRYQVIRGVDFYRHAHQELAGLPNVEFLKGSVTQVQDGPQYALVTVDEDTFRSKWVFDSLNKPPGLARDVEHYHHLNLYFKGWEIETQEPAFDPQAATLMDFRTPQRQDTRFFYVLPFSTHRALVEYTVFTQSRVGDYERRHALETYLEDVLNVNSFRILGEEGGRIPITDQPQPRRLGRRVMAIGAKGGRVKPTTGYAFSRIQKDSAAIVQSLLQTGTPFDVPEDPQIYHLMDSILLEIMCTQGDQVLPIFTALFLNNPPERIFRFLDETASPQDILLMIETLPQRVFLQALFRLQMLGKLSWRHLHDLIRL